MFSKKLIIVFTVLVFTVLVSAEVPQLINYQGFLSDSEGNPLPDTTLDITFSIYRETGVLVWTSGPQAVSVNNGLFEYKLGTHVPLTNLHISSTYNRFLGIKIGEDPELVPQTQLISVPYAYKASYSDTAGTVIDNSVTSAQIVDETITTTDIQNGSIYSPDIANESILNIDIAPNAEIEVTKIMGTAVDLVSDQLITGTKTFEDIILLPTPRSLALSQAAFVPGNSSYSYQRGSNLIRNTVNNIQAYYAQVSLPDGAEIGPIECTFYDNDVSYDATWSFVRVGTNITGEALISSGSTTGTPGIVSVTDNSPNPIFVDNENYNYVFIIILRTDSDPADMWFRGAEIKYLISRPLP